MPGKVQILDTYMDPSVTNFIQIDVSPATVPSGLVAYYGLETPAFSLDANGKLNRLEPWTGTKPLTQSDAASAPTVETIANGHRVMRTQASLLQRVITGPTKPAGEAYTESFASGITVTFVVQSMDAALTHGLLAIAGFRVRYIATSGTIQIQRFTGSTTANAQIAGSLADLSIVTFAFDAASNVLKIYKNGTLLLTNTGNFLGTNYPGPLSLFYGTNFNGSGDASTARFGTVAIHNRALTDAEVLGMIPKIKTRYGIA